MRIAAWVITLLALAGCSGTRPAPQGDVYVLRNDNGGHILSAEIDRKQLLDWGKRVEIHGYCVSSCTMFTTLPNACLMPDSRIGFHGATISIGAGGNAQVSKYLRGEIKRRFDADWHRVPQKQFHWVEARDYVRLDPQARLCAR